MSNTSSEIFVEVAVKAPLPHTLTYKTQTPHLLGKRVKVPLGFRTVEGVVLETDVTPDTTFKTKALVEIQSEYPPLSETHLHWLKWLAKYYHHPIGQVVNLAYPPLKESKRLRKTQKTPVIPQQNYEEPPPLTKEQQQVVNSISLKKGFESHLLFGVTGSGKTEVYLRLIERALEENKKTLLLVPEISLTPQLIKRFSARFPKDVATIHSQLTPREKTDQWWSLLKSERRILIGARSALFCPLSDLGLIIVDEEHEASYKQDEKLKYHARDAAIVKAQMEKCTILLGSATPSLESWKNALEGKYQKHEMKSRVSSKPLPEVTLVDMTEKAKVPKTESSKSLPFWLSPQLHGALTETLKQNQQAALFLNRRGMAAVTQCSQCGFVHECPNCAISLTLHAKKYLICHYCDYAEPFKEICPSCDSTEINPLGLGTEQVEIEMAKLFPGAILARADRDEINTREDLERLIFSMESGDIDILIGTQMIAKGLDFPKLTLVGLLLADVGLHRPDFRAAERCYQLVTQVSGRAGRHSQNRGQVFLQTHTPSHRNFSLTRESDFPQFAEEELRLREQLNYPPYGRLASVRFSGSNLHDVSQLSEDFGAAARKLQQHRKQYQDIFLLGPSPAALPKLRNKYRYHLLVKFPNHNLGHTFFQEIMPLFAKTPPRTKISLDIDPVNMV